MLELWQHRWPQPILKLVAFCSRAILSVLHKIRRGEGHRQCNTSSRSLSLIVLSVGWLHALLASPLPQTFLELFEVVSGSQERASDAVTAHLDEIVRFEGATEALPASDLYTSMVSSFRTMSETVFDKSLAQLYHTDDEHSGSGRSVSCTGSLEYSRTRGGFPGEF